MNNFSVKSARSAKLSLMFDIVHVLKNSWHLETKLNSLFENVLSEFWDRYILPLLLLITLLFLNCTCSEFLLSGLYILGLLLLLSLSLSSSSLFIVTLLSVFAIMYLKRTTFLGYIVMQLFCSFRFCYMWCYFPCSMFCTLILVFSEKCLQCPMLLFSLVL